MTPKPKTTFIVLAATAIAGLGLLFPMQSVGADDNPAATTQGKTLYTCGMHPQVIQDHPGNCPICGMKLTRLNRDTGQRTIKYYQSTMNPGEISQEPGKDSMGMEMVPVYEEASGAGGPTIVIDPVTIQDMGIRTGVVTRGPLRRVVRTVGVIDYAESALADVTTKFKGWIEKLYVDTTGQQVHRGEPLFEIYSPELYSAQVEYVLSLQTATRSADPGSDALRASARLKLKYWDISDQQIDELEETRKPRKTLSVLAPIDGFVIEKDVVEGQMVNAGMNIYRLADLGLVWVQAEIYEQDLPYLKLGQEAVVTLSYLPDRKFRGRVTYIYPYLDPKTRTVKVRMEFHNPGYFLKPGMYASVEVHAELASSALLVPDSAVLRSGQRNTVFVALPGGKFDPRTVTLGPRAENDRVQVLSGLKDGERIVTSGQFLLDSESQLREAIQKMIEPGKASAMEEMTNTNDETHTDVTAPPAGGPVVWVCPMPEHVSIEYEHSGECPICGMTLVPVTKSMLEKLQPGGKVLYYTCPMPEHSDVKLSKPGKCPKCGMTLIPIMEQGAGAPGAHDPESTGDSNHGHPPQAPSSQDPATPTLYTCPMASHAHVVADKPGVCPECEMKLVPTSTVAHGKVAEAEWRKEHPEAGGER